MNDSTTTVGAGAQTVQTVQATPTTQTTHFADSFGAVCRSHGDDPATSYDYRDVTCGECRHAAPYISALPDHLKPRSTRRRSWPRSMQDHS